MLGAKVAVCDFVQPSPAGTKWGLGGTCVNVGCIPKKLMHQAALLGEGMSDARSYGWEVPEVSHKWEAMVENVQNHIKSLNFGYRSELMTEGIKYLNAYAVFTDPHTIECTDKKGKVTTVTGARFVIAVGGRPRYPEIPGGKELTISSDDLFALPSPPGTTLCIGASYISLECAGFIHGLGMKAHVMMRSIPLRGFDQQMAGQVKAYMQEHGVSFIEQAVPTAVEAAENGQKKVTWKYADGTVGEGLFDTVLVAIGRDAETSKIGLDKAGVQVNPKTGKIPAKGEQTNVEHIFAIGDVLDGRPELTPVAIQAGKLLAKRIFAGATKPMDYDGVPTTVFTPLEYGCVGLSEEDAIAKLGEVRGGRASPRRRARRMPPSRRARASPSLAPGLRASLSPRRPARCGCPAPRRPTSRCTTRTSSRSSGRCHTAATTRATPSWSSTIATTSASSASTCVGPPRARSRRALRSR